MQLPIESALSAARVAVPRHQRLSLARAENGGFSFDVETAEPVDGADRASRDRLGESTVGHDDASSDDQPARSH